MKKKSVGELGLVLLCAGLLLAVNAPAQTDRSAAETAISPAELGQLSSANAAQPLVYEKAGVEPEQKELEALSDEQLKFMEEYPGKEWPVEDGALSAFPLAVGYAESRGVCVGDKDIDGAGTTAWGYTLNVYYKNRRSTTIYLASEFGCDGGPISGVRYYVSQVPALQMPNLLIRLRHTTATAYSVACFDNTGWTDCYGPTNTTITQIGWYTFMFATPFEYNGIDNLEVDVSLGTLPEYNNSGQVWSFTGSGNRSLTAQSDTIGDPANWTCGTGNPTVTMRTGVPRMQFIFPPPNDGACCVDYVCVATTTEPDCLAMNGTWYGGETCPEFVCPPWNDNCGAVTPVALTPGVPVQFTGNNLGATNDCGLFAGGQVWHAITLPGVDSFFDVWLDYCTTSPAFGNAWLNWAVGCPCTSASAAGTFDTTTCGDGNVTIKWSSLTSGTYYYPVLLDPASGAAGDYVINVVCTQAYCASGATSTADEMLKEVSFVDIYNLTTDCAKYSDFTDISTDVIAGQTYPIDLIIGDCEGTSCYSKRVSIFMDLNQDYVFDNPGERVYYSGQLTNTPCPDFPLSGMITIPASATTGCTRMRIVVVETSSVEPPPCGTYTWGETEDYTVCILPPPPEGACCFGMTCEAPLTEADCLAAEGVYKGDGTTCTPNPCIGACCFMDGTCQEVLNLAECAGLGGNYQGDGTDCDPNLCPQPGNNCDNPKPILLTAGALPYVDTDTTCGRGNNYADTCLGYYDGGEDILYEVIVPEPLCVTIAVDGVLTYVGVAIDYSCPPGLTCLAFNNNSAGNPVIENLSLAAGTYYIMIDTWPSPPCSDFTMTISACPEPGACCFSDGSCQELLPTPCATAGGIFQGDGTTCDPNPCQPTYCTAGSSTVNCDEYISRVEFGTIDNATGCSQPGGYGDYTYLSTDVPYGIPMQITVTNGKPYTSDQCKVWIDWNQDLDFYDDGEGITMTGSPGVGPYTATILAPNDALSGPARMRVRITYTGLLDPCGITTYGEVEDYTVNIVEVPGACCQNDGTCTLELPSECFGYYGGPYTECAGEDCNLNGADDFCDIASGYSEDCDGNGIPDECQPWCDCNENGIADFCDLALGYSQDCNENGIPDECDVLPLCQAGAPCFPEVCSEDCQGDGIPDDCQLGSGGISLQIDDGSSENNWGLTNGGELCWLNHFNAGGPANVAGLSVCFGSPAYPGSAGVTPGGAVRIYVWSDPNQDGNPADAVFLGEGTGVVEAGSIDTDVVQYVTFPAPIAVNGSFFAGASVNHPAGGYPVPADDNGWTGAPDQGYLAYNSVPFDPANLTANLVSATGLGYPQTVWILRVGSGAGGGGGDCNENGVPDECDVPPICEGPDCSLDCQPDLIPDECQLEGNDCNENGRPDDCDIASGWSLDCQPDGIPDECQLEGNDCNENEVPDECDIANGTSQDCNNNGIPDECDIASGLSCDCQGDGIPDECQLYTREVLWDNGPLSTHPGGGCGGDLSVLQDTLGLTLYGLGAQQTAGNHVADDFTLEGACHIDTITVFTYQTGTAPPSITGVFMQIWDGPPNAGGSVIWGDLTTNRLASCTASGIYRTLPTVDCTRHIQTVVATVDTSLAAGTYWVDFQFTGSGASGPWVPPVTILGLTGKPGANALQYTSSAGAWAAILDGTYPQDVPFIINGQCGAPPNDCNENGIPDECDIGTQWGGYCEGQGGCWPVDCGSDWNGNGVPDECELCGDIDEDGDVDLDDYWAFYNAFGTCVGHPKYEANADMDGDGCITLVDYRAWRMCYLMANGKDFAVPKPQPMPTPTIAPTKSGVVR